MSWAQRLKRVFRIEIEQCERCGGRVRVIAGVGDPAVIGTILAHREQRGLDRVAAAGLRGGQRPRGPPGQGALAFG
jgi:hypothetical protein